MPTRYSRYPLPVLWRGLSRALVVLLGVGPLPLLAQQSAVSHNIIGGYYYSKGDYDQDADTTIHYFPFSYDITVSGWNLKASLAHLQVSGIGNVLVNVGGVVEADPGLPKESGTWRGLGDSVLSATYQLPALSASGPFVDIGLEVKVPTANEDKGLGTGATDYGVQVDLYQMLGDTTWFGTAGYRFRGSSSVFAHLRDSAYLSLGFSRPASDSWSYGLIYDYREAASASSHETHELLPYISLTPTPQWTLMTYLSKGFTPDSPDIAFGAQLGYRW